MFLHRLFVAGLVFVSASSAATAPGDPVAESHEVHLPSTHNSFTANVPSKRHCTHGDSGCGSTYLTFHFSVSNDSLFVNDDRIFPPSSPMQLQALRRFTTDDREEHVLLTYGLDVRPAAVGDRDAGHRNDSLIVHVEFFDENSSRASPNIMRIDLDRDPKEGLILSKITVRPTSRQDEEESRGNYPWEVKYWRIQGNSKPGAASAECSSDSYRRGRHCHRRQGLGEEKSSSLHNPAYSSDHHLYIPPEEPPKRYRLTHPHDGWIQRQRLLDLMGPGLEPSVLGVMGVVAGFLLAVVGRTTVSRRLRHAMENETSGASALSNFELSSKSIAAMEEGRCQGSLGDPPGQPTSSLRDDNKEE